MAFQDYQVTTAGHKKIMHNGVVCHMNRLVNMDAANSVTQLLLRLGWITATLTATAHDVAAGTPVGTQSTEGMTTYHVTAAGAQRINHNQVTLAQGAAITLDPQDDEAAFLLGKGWIS